MKLAQKHSKIALGYFLLIAFLGVLLRAFPVVNVPVNYKFIVHTHSHIALLGWIYTALTTLIYQLFLKQNIAQKKYKRLFWVTQASLIGMLVTFPFMGYKLFSILFSTVFIFTSYYFVYCFLKYTTIVQKTMQSYLFFRTALVYMVLSSFGPLLLGVIMNTSGKGSALYKNAIYFYLHFQYNGWFIVALLGVFIFILEKMKLKIPTKTFRIFFWWFNIGVVLTFCQSLLWMRNVPLLINGVAIIGAVLQIIGVGFLLKYVYGNKKQIQTEMQKSTYQLFKMVIILFFIKLGMQLIGALPMFSQKLTTNIDMVIGYLHWTFLGVVTISLFCFLSYFKLIKLSKPTIIIYLIGFLTTEFLIFYRGASSFLKLHDFENFNMYLLVASVFLLIGIMLTLIKQFLRQTINNFSK